MIFLRFFHDKNNQKGRVSAMGTLLEKPIINFNPYGEFIEIIFYLNSDDIGHTKITLVCNVKNGSFPRLHQKAICCGCFVVIRNLEQVGSSELHGDFRKTEIEFLHLDLSRIDSNLQKFIKVIIFLKIEIYDLFDS